MTEHTLAEEIDMMSRPDKWPHTFVLPLKSKVERDGSFPRDGFLYQPSFKHPVPPPEPVVYLGNIFMRTPPSELECVTYPDLAAVAAEWRVD